MSATTVRPTTVSVGLAGKGGACSSNSSSGHVGVGEEGGAGKHASWAGEQSPSHGTSRRGRGSGSGATSTTSAPNGSSSSASASGGPLTGSTVVATASAVLKRLGSMTPSASLARSINGMTVSSAGVYTQATSCSNGSVTGGDPSGVDGGVDVSLADDSGASRGGGKRPLSELPVQPVFTMEEYKAPTHVAGESRGWRSKDTVFTRMVKKDKRSKSKFGRSGSSGRPDGGWQNEDRAWLCPFAHSDMPRRNCSGGAPDSDNGHDGDSSSAASGYDSSVTYRTSSQSTATDVSPRRGASRTESGHMDDNEPQHLRRQQLEALGDDRSSTRRSQTPTDSSATAGAGGPYVHWVPPGGRDGPRTPPSPRRCGPSTRPEVEDAGRRSSTDRPLTGSFDSPSKPANGYVPPPRSVAPPRSLGEAAGGGKYVKSHALRALKDRARAVTDDDRHSCTSGPSSGSTSATTSRNTSTDSMHSLIGLPSITTSALPAVDGGGSGASGGCGGGHPLGQPSRRSGRSGVGGYGPVVDPAATYATENGHNLPSPHPQKQQQQQQQQLREPLAGTGSTEHDAYLHQRGPNQGVGPGVAVGTMERHQQLPAPGGPHGQTGAWPSAAVGYDSYGSATMSSAPAVPPTGSVSPSRSNRRHEAATTLPALQPHALMDARQRHTSSPLRMGHEPEHSRVSLGSLPAGAAARRTQNRRSRAATRAPVADHQTETDISFSAGKFFSGDYADKRYYGNSNDDDDDDEDDEDDDGDDDYDEEDDDNEDDEREGGDVDEFEDVHRERDVSSLVSLARRLASDGRNVNGSGWATHAGQAVDDGQVMMGDATASPWSACHSSNGTSPHGSQPPPLGAQKQLSSSSTELSHTQSQPVFTHANLMVQGHHATAPGTEAYHTPRGVRTFTARGRTGDLSASSMPLIHFHSPMFHHSQGSNPLGSHDTTAMLTVSASLPVLHRGPVPTAHGACMLHPSNNQWGSGGGNPSSISSSNGGTHGVDGGGAALELTDARGAHLPSSGVAGQPAVGHDVMLAEAEEQQQFHSSASQSGHAEGQSMEAPLNGEMLENQRLSSSHRDPSLKRSRRPSDQPYASNDGGRRRRLKNSPTVSDRGSGSSGSLKSGTSMRVKEPSRKRSSGRNQFGGQTSDTTRTVRRQHSEYFTTAEEILMWHQDQLDSSSDESNDWSGAKPAQVSSTLTHQSLGSNGSAHGSRMPPANPPATASNAFGNTVDAMSPPMDQRAHAMSAGAPPRSYSGSSGCDNTSGQHRRPAVAGVTSILDWAIGFDGVSADQQDIVRCSSVLGEETVESDDELAMFSGVDVRTIIVDEGVKMEFVGAAPRSSEAGVLQSPAGATGPPPSVMRLPRKRSVRFHSQLDDGPQVGSATNFETNSFYYDAGSSGDGDDGGRRSNSGMASTYEIQSDKSVGSDCSFFGIIHEPRNDSSHGAMCRMGSGDASGYVAPFSVYNPDVGEERPIVRGRSGTSSNSSSWSVMDVALSDLTATSAAERGRQSHPGGGTTNALRERQRQARNHRRGGSVPPPEDTAVGQQQALLPPSRALGGNAGGAAGPPPSGESQLGAPSANRHPNIDGSGGGGGGNGSGGIVVFPTEDELLLSRSGSSTHSSLRPSMYDFLANQNQGRCYIFADRVFYEHSGSDSRGGSSRTTSANSDFCGCEDDDKISQGTSSTTHETRGGTHTNVSSRRSPFLRDLGVVSGAPTADGAGAGVRAHEQRGAGKWAGSTGNPGGHVASPPAPQAPRHTPGARKEERRRRERDETLNSPQHTSPRGRRSSSNARGGGSWGARHAGQGDPSKPFKVAVNSSDETAYLESLRKTASRHEAHLRQALIHGNGGGGSASNNSSSRNSSRPGSNDDGSNGEAPRGTVTGSDIVQSGRGGGGPTSFPFSVSHATQGGASGNASVRKALQAGFQPLTVAMDRFATLRQMMLKKPLQDDGDTDTLNECDEKHGAPRTAILSTTQNHSMGLSQATVNTVCLDPPSTEAVVSGHHGDGGDAGGGVWH